MLNEAKIIAYLKAQFPTHIGDDAAVIPLSKDQSYVITNDLLVEDVHFRIIYNDAPDLAHKALHVNLSDIAAMGAKPLFILLGISIPKSAENYTFSFLSNLAEACKNASVLLIGGDTTKSPDKLFISITVIGIALPSNLKYRHNAAVGDLICVAGNLGYAHIGFTALETFKKGFDEFKAAFLKPNALLAEGHWLGQQPAISAMMDISDGLFVDLQRFCEASKVAATIELDNLSTPSAKFIASCKKLNLDPLISQLIGGEDYGLLLTICPAQYSQLATTFKTTFGYNLKPIGIINKGAGVHFMQKGHPKNLKLQPFSHFGELS